MSLVIRFFCFCLFFSFSLRSSETIPLDERVHVGQLDNGLVYYLQKNEFPKERASIRLVVKAGSLHEEEEQRGLAHFLEHMNFRGSKNVKDWEMIRYLESVGAKFGADTNATTSFSRTIYELDLPKATPEVLERGLFILADMAGRATLDPALVEKEKRVILEEYNLSKNVQSRLITKFFETFCKGSLYTERMPIGLKEVILHANAANIRAFYEKWYRPDRMAVVVVGDCDTTLVEGLIKEYFGYLAAPKEMLTEPCREIEFSQDRIIASFIDKEVSENTIELYFFQENRSSPTVSRRGVRSGVISILFREWFEHRLQSLIRKNVPPFLSFNMGSSDFEDYEIFSLGVNYFEERPLDALKALYTEIVRAQKFGPTAQEFSFLVRNLRQGIAATLLNGDRTEHGEFAEKYISHFLTQEAYSDEIAFLECMQELLEEVTAEDLRLRAERDLFFDDFHIFFTAAKEGVLSVKDIQDWLENLEEITVEEEIAQREDLADFVVSFEESVLPYSESVHKEYTLLSLQNGMQIVLHPAHLEKDQILFAAFAHGGKTLFQEEAYPAIGVSCEYMIRSGLGNLSGQKLQEYLQEKNIRYSCHILPNMRSIQLIGSRKHFEDYCRLFLATFQERRSSPEVLENLSICRKEILKQQRNDPFFLFLERAQEILFSSDPFYKIDCDEKATFEQVEEILSKVFRRPEEYTLVIIGDFSSDEVKPILLSYLNYKGEKSDLIETFLPSYSFPQEDVCEKICVGSESSCFNYVVYGLTNFAPILRESMYPLKALSLLLQDRLLTKMRQEMGEIYTCACIADFPLYPNCRDLFFTIFFSCETGKEALLKEVLQEEIKALLEKEISDTEIQTLKALVKADSKSLYQYNSGWLKAHQDQFLWDLPLFTEEERDMEIENRVTKDNLIEMAKLIFENRPKVEITRHPAD